MEQLILRRVCLGFFLFIVTGCAQALGIEEFTVAESSTNGGSGGSGGSGGGNGGGQTIDPCIEVHGCKRDTAMDFTNSSTVAISFDINGYTPKCILADNNSTLTLDGQPYTFDDVPVTGGVYPTADPASPIQNPMPSNVSMASFTLGTKCSYPYFSPTLKIAGVVFIK